MAAVGNQYSTLVDRATLLGRNGKALTVAQLLAQTNDIIADMPYVDANEGLTHKILQQVGLPEAYWAQINKGIPDSKAKQIAVKEGTAILQSLQNTDTRMPDVNVIRSNNMVASMSSLANKMASEFFYGTAANPEGLVGLSARYSSSSSGNGQNIIKMGGSGADNASIWLIGLGRRAIYGILPKDYSAGIKHKDQGMHPVVDGDGNSYMAHRDEYMFASGLAVEDWRCAVRICNIDVSVVGADPDGSSVSLNNAIIKASHRVPSLTMPGVKYYLYMNADMLTALDTQRTNKSNGFLNVREVDGVMRNYWRDIPVRRCDALLSTESAVS